MLKKRKMASGFGKIFVCMLSAVFTFGFVSGCAQKSDPKPTESPATVWFAPATQKIRPLISKTEYASIAETKLDIQTGKAEYFLGQEGVSGNPFPYITDISVDKNDCLNITSYTATGKVFFKYDSKGNLLFQCSVRYPFHSQHDSIDYGKNYIAT